MKKLIAAAIAASFATVAFAQDKKAPEAAKAPAKAEAKKDGKAAPKAEAKKDEKAKAAK